MRLPENGIRWAALLVAGVLLAWSVCPWPDDWDGIGFVASVSRFDLDHFAPHPPGYPVYVALLRVASTVTPNAVFAANAVAVASGMVLLGALGAAVHRVPLPLGPSWAACLVIAVVASCPLVWRSMSSIGSEAPALAFASLAVYGLARGDERGAAIVGAAVGLGLGVRASWAPLLLPMLAVPPSRHRVRACLFALGATLAWAVPFVLVVGPSHLAVLLRTHLLGHASRWGGTALTEPLRARYLARDVFVDGLGVGDDGLGAAIVALGAPLLLLGLTRWRRASWRGARAALLVLGPYLAWIAVGQNLRQQPRHVLPLVVAVAVGLGFVGATVKSARPAIAVLFLLLVGRTAADARDRKTTPPPGEQLVAFVRRLPDSSRVAVFGGASERFFEGTELGPQAKPAGALGDVLLALGRVDRLPARVLVTGEVEGLRESPYPLERLATFSRPERIDRRAPSLDLYELHAPFLPRE